MKNYIDLFLKQIEKYLLWMYIVVCMLQFDIPYSTLIENIVHILGLTAGFATKIIIVLMYWKVWKIRYVKTNEIKIVRIVIGFFLYN